MASPDTHGYSTYAPLALSGILGGAAYGSHKLEQLMDDIGIKKNYTLNPEAVQAMDAYANIRPGGLRPDDFAVEYSNLANRAGSARLFNEDPRRIWEWEINELGARSRSERLLRSMLSKGDSLGRSVENSRVSKPISRAFNRVYAPIRSRIEALAKMVSPMRSGSAAEYAHTPEMSQSALRSYIRLLHENAINTKTVELADNTLEALINFKNPTFKSYLGKSFATAEDYFDALNGNVGKTRIPGLYRNYLSSFSDAVRNNPTNSAGGLAREIRGMIAPGGVVSKYDNKLTRFSLLSELNKLVGKPVKWEFGTDGLIRQVEGKAGLGWKPNPGIRSVQDIVDIAQRHPGLKFLNARAAKEYGRVGLGYGKAFNVLKTLLKIKDPRLRLALGIGSAGSGLYGLVNIFRNRKGPVK